MHVLCLSLAPVKLLHSTDVLCHLYITALYNFGNKHWFDLKGDERFNRKGHFLGSHSAETLRLIFQKTGIIHYARPDMQILGSIHSKPYTPSRVYFLLLLGPLHIATGWPIGPITAVNSSNDATCCHTHSFYGMEINNLYLPPFSPKIRKYTLESTSHAHTVVWESCKDDQQSQWEMPNFGVCQHRTLGSIFKKFCTVDYVIDPTPHANTGVNRYKGVSAHAWNCHPTASIFSLFYRAIHIVLARYCYRKSSIRLSVCDVAVLWAYRLD